MARLVRKGEATVRIEGVGPYREAIALALIPEIRNPPTRRSKADLRVAEEAVVVRIEATDISALRAALSSYLHWIRGICDAIEGLR